MAQHAERKHAKFSASGMERYEACPGSATLSEGQPDKSSPWAVEGTEAHEVLEALLLRERDLKGLPDHIKSRPRAMFSYGKAASKFMIDRALKQQGLLLVETKVNLDFIHEDAGGTFDGAVVELFGTLDVFDYKYGAGVAVSANDNLQMATYAIGLAEQYNWNFKRIRMWIIQPRIKGYDGPTFWDIPTMELKDIWLPRIRNIIKRATEEPENYIEGDHCHWCKAKAVCPLKTTKRFERSTKVFKPLGGTNASEEKEESNIKSEAQWREEAKAKKGRKAQKEILADGNDGDDYFR